jgi:hypothetical protein
MKHSPLEANQQLADEGVRSPDRRRAFRKARGAVGSECDA